MTFEPGQILAAYQSPEWDLSAGYSQVGEQFNPEVGFLQRRGREQWYSGYVIRVAKVERAYSFFRDGTA